MHTTRCVPHDPGKHCNNCSVRRESRGSTQQPTHCILPKFTMTASSLTEHHLRRSRAGRRGSKTTRSWRIHAQGRRSRATHAYRQCVSLRLVDACRIGAGCCVPAVRHRLADVIIRGRFKARYRLRSRRRDSSGAARRFWCTDKLPVCCPGTSDTCVDRKVSQV
jgi:hypothetical protein